ncbi:hypothetical protein BGZ58_003515, partial [Dissophora ornata]
PDLIKQSSSQLTTMRISSLFITVSCVVAIATGDCGGGTISKTEASYLVNALNNVAVAQVFDNIKTYCSGNMCVDCVNNGFSGVEFQNLCSQACSEIRPAVGSGSSGYCNYPGIRGLTEVSYWRATSSLYAESTKPLKSLSSTNSTKA